jgi:hypothetical protein
MEPRFGHDFSHVRVHADDLAAQSARAVHARAYTVGSDVVFGQGQYTPQGLAGRRLLAHELTHVLQQRAGSRSPCPSRPVIRPVIRPDNRAEQEADSAAEAIRHEGSAKVGVGKVAPVLQRQGTPRDQMVVAQARRRLPLLRRYVDEWSAREARQGRTARERDPLLERRRQMDRRAGESGADLVETAHPGTREAVERQNIAALNRRPLTMNLTENSVVFRVRFHARFEDAAMASRFDELAATLRRGVGLVWNQRLRGEVFGGRRFRVEPEVTPAAATAARDQNFWLITVRPSNEAPIAYPGCAFDQGPAGVPTSATLADCAGGVISIPPAHITNAGVLGHELLHLFGLVDRYVNLVHQLPGQRPVSVNAPTRETGGRRDPLGAQEGTVLAEDLAFLFDRLGVYAMEEGRGLETLRRLERQGLSIGAVLAEIHRLEGILRLGHDPRSLIRIRRGFADQVVRSVEGL